jgi:peptidoglycan/LPS O-acetylase OafA/YrhL
MGNARPFDRSDAVPLVPTAPATADDRAPSRLLGLELLRFGAALSILFFHYSHFARMAGATPIARADVPFYFALWPLYDYGQFGVQLFWGISGYIFFWKYAEAIHARSVAASRFFWLRFSRLYPLHIVTLLTVVALQAIHRRLAGFDFIYPAQDGSLFARQIFLATDWAAPSPFSFNGPIWSISAEVAIYAAFFLLLRQLAATAKLCTVVIAASLALQLAGLNWVSIACAGYFFAGGLAALAPRRLRPHAAAALVILLTGCAAAGVLGDRDKLPTILLMAVPCLLLFCSADGAWLSRWQRSIEAAGNLTYSTYLLHFPLQLMLAIAVAGSGISLPMTSPLFLAAYLGIVMAAGWLSYRLFELPAQAWIRRRTIGNRV